MLYLAPESSLQLMRYLRSVGGADGLEGEPVTGKRLQDAANTVRALKEMDETAQRWLGLVDAPVHAFVSQQRESTTTKRLVTHLLPEPVPTGAFLHLGHDVCICTPQFAFMRMSAKLDLIDTVCLGMELTGSYSKWAPEPLESAGDTATPSCTFELPALLRASDLRTFVDRRKGQRGASGARPALRWVLDGSASPMETAVYLLLCLPKRLGGYALPKPALNPKLVLQTSEGPKVRYPDLYWEGRGIDVEYNSDQEHSGEWARHHDSKREIELAGADVRTLPLTREQLMSADEFNEFAWILRRMLGVRARKPDPDWFWRRDDLRARLLGPQRTR